MKGKKDNYFDIIHCLCLHYMCMRFQMIHFSSSVWVKNDFCHKDHINECFFRPEKFTEHHLYMDHVSRLRICVVVGSVLWQDLWFDGICIVMGSSSTHPGFYAMYMYSHPSSITNFYAPPPPFFLWWRFYLSVAIPQCRMKRESG